MSADPLLAFVILPNKLINRAVVMGVLVPEDFLEDSLSVFVGKFFITYCAFILLFTARVSVPFYLFIAAALRADSLVFLQVIVTFMEIS